MSSHESVLGQVVFSGRCTTLKAGRKSASDLTALQVNVASARSFRATRGERGSGSGRNRFFSLFCEAQLSQSVRLLANGLCLGVVRRGRRLVYALSRYQISGDRFLAEGLTGF